MPNIHGSQTIGTIRRLLIDHGKQVRLNLLVTIMRLRKTHIIALLGTNGKHTTVSNRSGGVQLFIEIPASAFVLANSMDVVVVAESLLLLQKLRS